MSRDSWKPEQYEKFKNERSQPFFDLMEMLQAQAQPKLIDLGCGTGELTSVLHQNIKAQESIGLDSSDKMLQEAGKFQTKNLKFQNGNIQNWCEPQQYDIIFSNAAIQWCQDHKIIFENLKKSLRPDGQLAVQMPMNHDYPTHIIAHQLKNEEIFKDGFLSEKPKDPSLLKPEEYSEILYRLGFKEQKVLVRVYTHSLESREGVIEWVKGTLLTAFQSSMSEDKFQKFLTEFKRRLFLELPDEKPFFYPFKRILIWGRL